MLLTNPFSEIATSIPPVFMQAFVIIMILSVIISTLLDMAHKKNAKYFFINLKKSKEAAKRKVSTSKKTSIIVKTVASDIMTTSELGVGQRRVAHLLGMYGSIMFWITSFIMIFFYSSPSIITPDFLPILWHLGALMTCLGGYWFWLFLRDDVSAEGHSWSRIIRADLFVLSLVTASTFALIWSYLQYSGLGILSSLFLILFVLSNIILFGGVYWSKFAHMFYKPGAALQKNLSEEDGSRDWLPEPSSKPKKFGLGIKRESARHY